MNAAAGKVLIVDDNALNRAVLSTNLKNEGYDIKTAENGLQALTLLGMQPFDVILLDLMMPEMDGFETLERIKADENLRHVPVIIISAMDEIESVVRCIEMGAVDYLQKPFNPVILRARLHASLASKRMRDIEQAYMGQIQAEQEKSERLLLSILPGPIADQLKQGEQTIAQKFDNVTVLFADIVGFTKFAAHNTPELVLDTLNSIFSTFDQLAERHQLEKIKTIGDAYMAASGLPIPRKDHAEAIAEMALDMQDAVTQLNQTEINFPEAIQMRIGIHSGPVIAGVIGTKKFAYDLWGNTVNVASRIESRGTPGGISVSEETYQLIQNNYLLEAQPPKYARRRSDIEKTTYLLIGRNAK